MATLEFKGSFNKTDIAAYVVAGAQDTPGITSNNPVFSVTVDWGTDGQTTTYTNTSNNGIVIKNKRVDLIHTDNDTEDIKYYTSSGLKTIVITGGWKNSASDSESYLALPKQSVTRYGSNNFLNNKKGAISLSTEGERLVFKFDDDYVGVRSDDGIKLVKWRKYTIAENNVNFRIDSDADVDATYTSNELNAKGKAGFLKYYYDILGVTYSGEFEIVSSIDTGVAPAGNVWSLMTTQRHKMDTSLYNSYTFNDTTITPQNKHKAYHINLGSGFKLHGVGDFAMYNKLSRVENKSGYTQTFTGEMNHMFAGCAKFKFSSVLSSMDMSGITKMIGVMSGCGVYTEWFKLNDVKGTDGNGDYILTDLTGAFEFSNFKANNIKRWKVDNVTSVESMLEQTPYNKAGISESWNSGNITNFKYMFKHNTSFQKYIGGMDTSGAQDMEGMFHGASSYNGFMNTWDTSNVTSFKNMFRDASSYNKKMDKWNTGNATDMSNMFNGASSFNQWIITNQSKNRWVMSNVETMEGMFRGATSFNRAVNGWNISKCRSFRNMFNGASSYDQYMNKWFDKFGDGQSAPKTVNFEGMFQESAYNKPLKGWDVSHATSIKNMFKDNTAFAQDLFPGWKLKATLCKNVTGFIDGATALASSLDGVEAPTSGKHFLATYGNSVKWAKGFTVMMGADDAAFPDGLKSQPFLDARSTFEVDYIHLTEELTAKSKMMTNYGTNSWDSNNGPKDIFFETPKDGPVSKIFLYLGYINSSASDLDNKSSGLRLIIYDTDDNKVGELYTRGFGYSNPSNNRAGSSLSDAVNNGRVGWVQFGGNTNLSNHCDELVKDTKYRITILNDWGNAKSSFYWRATNQTDLHSDNNNTTRYNEWSCRIVQLTDERFRSDNEDSYIYSMTIDDVDNKKVIDSLTWTSDTIDTGDED